jgi:mxaJ protein
MSLHFPNSRHINAFRAKLFSRGDAAQAHSGSRRRPKLVATLVASVALHTGAITSFAAVDEQRNAADGSSASSASSAGSDVLRVCSDPNNMPFSNAQQEGFENALAQLVADALGRKKVVHYWHPQRRGFARRTLKQGNCDLIMGVPASYELAEPTRPYYRSTYVFVHRADSGLDITSVDDPDLRKLKIGVHMVGDDYSNTPGAEALGRRGLINNLVGYSIYGDYSKPHPPSRLIEAVAQGEVDVAIAWGPLAGYFAKRQDVPLKISPVTAEIDPDAVPFTFDIAMAVRRGDEAFRKQLETVIDTRAADIQALLMRYHVPLLAMPESNVSTPENEPRSGE